MSKWFPGRRLSWFRLTTLLVVVAALVVGAVFAWGSWQDQQEASERQPWSDGYVDVTATPSFAFESPGSTGPKNVVLAFVVGAPGDACAPTWGGAYGLDEAEATLDLDRRLARLRNLGGSAMVSFGGQANSDLALKCTDQAKLVAGYQSVVDRYELGSIDMDLEGELLANHDAVVRQAEAIAEVQQSTEDGLDVWLTLPVAPDGLTADGLHVLRSYQAAGVVVAGVNAMTMNYNSGDDVKLIDRVRSSLSALQMQLRAVAQEGGAPIGDATAWSRVSATPMIGQNDVRSEVFSLDDARALAEFANDRGMVRVSMWSLNRDRSCDANWPDPKQVSDSCSGVDQGDTRFAALLGAGRTGEISQVAEVDPLEPDAGPVVDDPETSPYPVWNPEAAYPAETKVVWRRNVYEAKWWTQNEQPDETLESGAQPWRLLGPVLPGEKPFERPQLPAGSYPDWVKETEYRQGDRVLFDGLGYEARWWTQGESPDAALVLPQNSPWRLLTDSEVAEVLSRVEAEPTA
ncbi:chitinase [Leucobacter luti]|uniref:Chitinase (Glycosyl hydrolase family 18) n=1 Tax=Leucobacter luti TaxID=340320 RepID=A0A4Q7U194_9MICO|nr:carbohydrate-binding protein [Leucobacter luti]MBL3699030.1 glycosyl hydrolase family 18 [Leucobacter luti]RZT66530.1 chitinase (glycosyl hydrolase family 18) [Leucobacter luti]